MKRLTLLRHAKSSWQQPGLTDKERPLNQRGLRDAPVMARRLAELSVRPSLIITSPAVRARETAKLIARAIGYPIEFLQTEQSLYLADPDTILEIIELQDDTFSDLVVVGHNPGMTEVANQLSGQTIDNIPTCGLVTIEADTDQWQTIGTVKRTFIGFDYPKNRG